MHLLPGEKVHMALKGTKQLEWLTLCFWKKSNQPGLNTNYRVHNERNDGFEILEKKNSLRFLLIRYNGYDRNDRYGRYIKDDRYNRYELNILSTV